MEAHSSSPDLPFLNLTLSLEQELTLQLCCNSVKKMSRDDLEGMTIEVVRQLMIQRNVTQQIMKSHALGS